MIAPAESKATVASDERSKCAFFRVINPSSTSFKGWAADVDAGGARALTPPSPRGCRGHVVPRCIRLWYSFVVLGSAHGAGIDATLATVFGWPLAALQHGVLRAMFTDVGIDMRSSDELAALHAPLDDGPRHADVRHPADAVACDLRTRGR